MFMCGQHLFRCKKGVCVRVGLFLLHDDIRGNGDKVMTVIMGVGVVAHLALQSTRCVVCPPGQRGSSTSVAFPPMLMNSEKETSCLMPRSSDGFP